MERNYVTVTLRTFEAALYKFAHYIYIYIYIYMYTLKTVTTEMQFE